MYASHIEELIALRNKAHAEKDWAEVDRIHNELSTWCYSKGTTWRVG